MKKVTNLFPVKEDVKKVRSSLEKKTDKIFVEFARSKQKVQELAHLKYLD